MNKLKKISTRAPKGFDKDAIKSKSVKLNSELSDLQNVLYAENKWKVLVIFQGLDASGKDGAAKNVFKGINPLGVHVKSFKSPTVEESNHNYLWRIFSSLPAKGMIQVFNRSYYEDILYPSVHKTIDKDILKNRFDQLNCLEEILVEDNTILLKFYLHISHKEQLIRLKERIALPEKNWKYSEADLKESKLWDNYMKVYELIFDKCDKNAKWMIVPADQNWYRDYVILKAIVEKLRSLKMKYPLIKKQRSSKS